MASPRWAFVVHAGCARAPDRGARQSAWLPLELMPMNQRDPQSSSKRQARRMITGPASHSDSPGRPLFHAAVFALACWFRALRLDRA